MWRNLVAGILCLSLVIIAPLKVMGAEPNPKEKSNQVAVTGPRKHLATIVFAGLAGAILGLSTLSFYGRPQDKLGNIAGGFAVGIFIGTIFTTYKAATEPKEFYSTRDASSEQWAALDGDYHQPATGPTPKMNFVFNF